MASVSVDQRDTQEAGPLRPLDAKEVELSTNRTTEESARIVLSIFKQQKIEADGLLLWSGLQQYYWAKAGGNAGFAEGTQWLLDKGYLEQRKPVRQAFYLTQAGYDAIADLGE